MTVTGAPHITAAKTGEGRPMNTGEGHPTTEA